jgi:glycosyltransferase involved in cell wall biosynthesis
VTRSSQFSAAVAEQLNDRLSALASVAGHLGSSWAPALRALGKGDLAWSVLTAIHRKGSAAAARRIETQLIEALSEAGNADRAGLAGYLIRSSQQIVASFLATPGQSAKRLIGTRMLVVQAAEADQKGVLIVDYNHVFPLLLALFDAAAIASRYHIVLEPSWVGYCTPEILVCKAANLFGFVQTREPRDRDLLVRLGQPFVPVYPLAANSWVDDRGFSPVPRDRRDIDVVMIAAWAKYKRHWSFFQAMGRLRQRGRRLKIALIGYPQDLSKADVLKQAGAFGIADQVEAYEGVPRQDVIGLLSRSKVHVLWSKREGTPRAIIEALFADVPIVMREGFNYGHRYHYINPQTGAFASEATLGDTLLRLLETKDVSPRAWAMQHMTCAVAARFLETAIREKAASDGEGWEPGIVRKVSGLHQQEYWDPEDRDRFSRDYAYLESTIRPQPSFAFVRSRDD